MKSLVFGILAFCTFCYTAYSYKCYQCLGNNDGNYTMEQCEKDQEVVDCHPWANYSCFAQRNVYTSGTVRVGRGCGFKEGCEIFKEVCKGPEKKNFNLTRCEAVCCVSDGDTPCNSLDRLRDESSGDNNGGFTVSINMFMIMFAVLCSLKQF